MSEPTANPETEPEETSTFEENPPDVYRALALVQRDLGVVGKDSTSGKGNRSYQYRGIDAVISNLHPLLGKYGLMIVPRVTSFHTDEHIWKAGQPDEKRESKAVLRVLYRVIASDGSCLPKDECPVVFAEGIDSGDKGTGKALSYAYKAAISQLLSIPTDDPDMNNENRNMNDDGLPADSSGWWDRWETRADHDDAKAEVFGLLAEGKKVGGEGYEKIKAELIDLKLLAETGHANKGAVKRDSVEKALNGLSEFLETHREADEAQTAAEQPDAVQEQPAEQAGSLDNDVLGFLVAQGGEVSTADIAAQLGEPADDVTEAIAQLVNNGLARQVSDDGMVIATLETEETE